MTFILSERARGASIGQIRHVLDTLPAARPPTVAETDLFLRRWRRVVEARLSSAGRCRDVVETGS